MRLSAGSDKTRHSMLTRKAAQRRLVKNDTLIATYDPYICGPEIDGDFGPLPGKD